MSEEDHVGKPNLSTKLAGLRSCGCTDAELCAQHIQAMSLEQRREYRRARGARGTNRGRGIQPEAGQ